MDTKQMVEKLKLETKRDPIFEAVMKVFAQRKRARTQVSVQALNAKMDSLGFDFSKTDYAGVLQKLHGAGVGTLETDTKGRVKSLKGIKIALKSVGEAALEEDAPPVKGFRPRNKYGEIEHEVAQANADATKSKLIVTIVINDKPVKIEVPKDLTNSETAQLINGLRDLV